MFDITAEKAAAAATLTAYGTPEHALACEICRLRGINPDLPALTGIASWQQVIAEQILETTLRHALQQASSARMASPFRPVG